LLPITPPATPPITPPKTAPTAPLPPRLFPELLLIPLLQQHLFLLLFAFYLYFTASQLVNIDPITIIVAI
jgi:hypothetical protein